jgi:hypothetical protein
MAKVYLHHKENDEGDWINEERQFTRVPCVGEHVALASNSLYYRVFAVVHCPFEADFEAEVYLHKPVSMTDVMQAGG